MRDKNTAAILAALTGSIGLHRFYLGQYGTGFLYLMFSMTFIPAILGLVDFFRLITMDQAEFDRRYNGAAAIAPPVVVNMLPPAGYPPPYGAPGYPPGSFGAPGYPTGAPMPPGYSAAPAQGASGGLSTDQLAAQLEKLNELRIAGLLTDDEFAAQKTRLLNQL